MHYYIVKPASLRCDCVSWLTHSRQPPLWQCRMPRSAMCWWRCLPSQESVTTLWSLVTPIAWLLHNTMTTSQHDTKQLLSIEHGIVDRGDGGLMAVWHSPLWKNANCKNSVCPQIIHSNKYLNQPHKINRWLTYHSPYCCRHNVVISIFDH